VACPASGSNSKMRGWMFREIRKCFLCNNVVYLELSHVSLLRGLKVFFSLQYRNSNKLRMARHNEQSVIRTTVGGNWNSEVCLMAGNP
jgi:hypothetical protein